MSNRFHNKFHRVNHHSDSSPNPKFPDAGYDPIASFESPFQGEFYSEGDIITTKNLSAGINLTVDNNALIRNNLVVGYNTLVENDLTVNGDFTVLGTTSQLETLVYVTSAMDVVNVGTGPALSVNQTGNEAVAQFLDDGITAFHISGLSATPGFIGINTNTPNEQLTIVGNLSAQGNSIITESSFVSGSSYIDNSLVVKDSLLYVDSTTNKVGINTNTPNEQLTIVGSISSTEDLFVGGLVGIGTSNPNVEMTVVGSISSTEDLFVGGNTNFKNNLLMEGLVIFNTVSSTAEPVTNLPTNGNDIELYSSFNVTITAFQNTVKGAMYTLTNKSSYTITLSSSPSLFVRNGTAWLSNTYTLSTAFLQLPPNYSCSLRIHDFDVASAW